MSRLDEPVDRASVIYSAHLTVRSHDAGYQCVCCRPDGCEQDAWARRELGKPPPHRRPAAPDGRREENSMSQLKWRTLKCDNSGPNCPEIATEGDAVYLRSSNSPMDIAVLTTAEFDTLKQKIRDGEV